MKFAFRDCVLLIVAANLMVGCSRDPNVRKQTYLESGIRYFEKGKYNEAAIQFENAIQVDPNFGQAHYELAKTYAKLQQYNDEGRELNLAIEKLASDEDKDRPRIDFANLLIGAGEYEQASQQLNAAEPRQLNNPSFHAARAYYYFGVKNPKAMSEMLKAISLDPNRSDLYLNLAALQNAAGNFDDAEASYKKAVSIDPKLMSAQFDLGMFYQGRGRLSEAEQQFRRAIETDPKSPEPRKALVRLLAIEGKNNEAEELARRTKHELSDDPAAYTMLGDFYFTLVGDVDRATAEYETLFHDHPKDLQVRKNLIQLLILKTRLQEASNLNNEILKTTPDDVEAQIFKAQIDLKQGNPGSAVTTLQGVVARDSGNALAHYVLGNAYAELGDQHRAESEWRETVRIKPDMSEAQRALINLATRNRDWGALDQLASMFIQAQPTMADGYAMRALAEINLKHFDLAEQSVQKAIEVGPRSPSGYLQLGGLRRLQGRYGDAEKAYRTVLDLDPASNEGLSGLMSTYLEQKDPDKAIAAAQAQIARTPNSSGFYDLLGNALFDDKRDYPGAESALRRAVALDPNNTDAILKLGQVLYVEGSPDQAIALYQQAVKDHPQEVPIYLLLGEMLEKRHDWSGAKAAYQKILELQPDSPIASNNLAYVMLQEGGNLDVALEMAKTARRRMPNSANAADTLGWAYYKKGAYANAIVFLQEAVTNSPNDASFHYHLGLAYQQAGKLQQSKEHLQKVLKIDPNFPDADEVRKSLSELHG